MPASTIDMILFNETYANSQTATSDTHVEGTFDFRAIFSSIADSRFYDLMNTNDLLIIANLPDEMRTTTWVGTTGRKRGH